MYDEYERAVTGGHREGISVLGWIAIALGTLFALGIVGVAAVTIAVKNQVTDFAEEVRREVQREIRAVPGLEAARMARHFESHARLLATRPEEGALMLQDLPSEEPAQAFMEDFFEGSLDFLSREDAFSLDLRGDEEGGALRISDGQDEVRMDLVKGEDGGSLVINSGDEQIRFDLRKTADGGFLAIDSDDGQVRFDLVRDGDGGSLIIKSEEGEVRFDAHGNEDGGSVVVRSEEGEFRFGAGADADGMPRWVPGVEGMPSDPQRVYSLSSPEGFLGAVAWQGEGEPKELLASYRDELKDRGYELASQYRMRDEGLDRYSLWARDDAADRVVYVVADRSDGTTRVLLGYGEGGE